MLKLKHTISSGLLALLLLGSIQGQGPTGKPPVDSESPVLPYSVVADFPDVPPEANFGEVAAVALDGRQHLYVFNRGPKPLMEFDAAGRYVRELARGLVSHAHGLRVDPEGYLWLVDDADHHVIKLDGRGRVMMVLGRRGLAGRRRNSSTVPPTWPSTAGVRSTSPTATLTRGWSSSRATANSYYLGAVRGAARDSSISPMRW